VSRRDDRTGPADEKQVVIEIRRVSKVTKGGKNFNFRALVVVGDGKGRAGYGIGKAGEVPDAIRKAVEKARKGMIQIPMRATTISHRIEEKVGPCRIVLRPASEGHGMVVGRTLRAFFDVAGVRDITGKCIGSTNPVNVIRAAVETLRLLKPAEGTGDETPSTQTATRQ